MGLWAQLRTHWLKSRLIWFFTVFWLMKQVAAIR